MATIGSLAIASDIANAALDFHIRGDALMQTMQQRPLLAFLEGAKETFPGGKTYISTPVQGTVMNDTSGFFGGYTQDSALTFTQASGIERPQVAWKQVHAGFVITQTEMLQDGVSLSDSGSRTSDHSNVMLTRLTAILKNRLQDFSESWARAKNLMLWQDGSQDANQVAGVLSLLLEDPTSGTVEGIAQATRTWWRSRVKLDLVPSEQNQTISKFFRNEVIQLTRFEGKPNRAFCGSSFWDALMQEVQAKGTYTTTGFKGDNDIGLNKISMQGIGTFEYEPTLDVLGLAKDCFVFDSRRIKLRPIEDEDNKTWDPARPYQYMVMLKSMTWAGGLLINQLNGMGRYRIS